MICLSRIIKSQYTNVDTNNIIIINGNQEAFIPQSLVGEAVNFETEALATTQALSPEEVLINAKNVAEHEASQIISNAKYQADIILKEAEQKSSLQAAEEFERARREGNLQGIEEANIEASKIRAEAEKIRTEANLYKENFIASIEPEVLELTISIMDKMIEGEKFLNENLASILVKQGLRQVPLADDITVHLSPEDYDKIDQLDIMKALDHVANLNLVMDVMLKPFQCIIETSLGNVDCSLDTTYLSLIENLRYILHNK